MSNNVQRCCLPFHRLLPYGLWDCSRDVHHFSTYRALKAFFTSKTQQLLSGVGSEYCAVYDVDDNAIQKLDSWRKAGLLDSNFRIQHGSKYCVAIIRLLPGREHENLS